MDAEFASSKVIGIAAITLFTIYIVRKFFAGKNKTKTTIKTGEHTKTTLTATPTTVQVSTVLNKDEYRNFKLDKVETLTGGALVKCPVKLFRFKLPKDSDSLGLPIGQHIRIRAEIDGEQILRSYTPTSTNDDKGYFDLVVKVYPNGKMTQYLNNLKIGDEIEVQGPSGRFVYKKNMYKEIGMIAGGTGITPMLQVIKEILKHSDDTTKVTLLFGNITEDDIILRQDIDALAEKYHNFHVYHVLNEPPQEWTMGKGFITSAIMQEHLPKPADDNKILLCGPPPMIKAMKDNLTTLGFTKDHIFSF